MIHDNGYWKILDIYSHTHTHTHTHMFKTNVRSIGNQTLDKTGMAIVNNNLETVATLGTKPQDDDKQENPHT